MYSFIHISPDIYLSYDIEIFCLNLITLFLVTAFDVDLFSLSIPSFEMSTKKIIQTHI